MWLPCDACMTLIINGKKNGLHLRCAGTPWCKITDCIWHPSTWITSKGDAALHTFWFYCPRTFPIYFSALLSMMSSNSKLLVGVMTHLPIYGHMGAVIILWHHTCTLDPRDRTTLKEKLRSGTRLMTHLLSMASLATYKSFKSKQWTGFCDSLWLARHPPDVGGSGYDVAHSIRLICHMLFPLEVPFINIATMVQLLV